MKTPTLTPALIAAVKSHLMAKAYTETIRPIVVGYQKEILERHKFPYKEDREMGEYVDNPSLDYLMADKDSDIYYAELDKAKALHPFGKDLEPGFCPLLIAENLQRQACQLMINEAAYIIGFSYDDIVMLEHYAEAEELVEKIVINHPHIDKGQFTSKAMMAQA